MQAMLVTLAFFTFTMAQAMLKELNLNMMEDTDLEDVEEAHFRQLSRKALGKKRMPFDSPDEKTALKKFRDDDTHVKFRDDDNHEQYMVNAQWKEVWLVLCMPIVSLLLIVLVGIRYMS